jgi:site-specific recombinase XerD
LANDILVRHYAPNTFNAYTPWVRHFHTWTQSQDPASLSSADVREFLTSLAVSASTQNQAFNALLFLYRHVLNKAFGKVEGVVRAKRTPSMPVV